MRTFSSDIFLSRNSRGKGCLPFFPAVGLLLDDATAASAAAVTSSSSERPYVSSTDRAIETRLLRGDARSFSRAVRSLPGEAGAEIRRCRMDAAP